MENKIKSVVGDVEVVEELLNRMSPEEIATVAARFGVSNNRVREILSVLSENQIEFTRHRLVEKTDKAAAERMGIHPQTVSRWPELPLIRELIRMAKMSAVERAMTIFEEHLEDAALVVTDQLTHTSNLVKFRAAVETLDRGMGKPVQKSETTGSREIRVRYVNDWRNTAADATSGSEVGIESEEEI